MPPQWDENKRISNPKKHGVDFKDVAKVFNPGRYVLYEDINDSIEFHKEVDSKGWNAVIRRLKKEGLGNSEVGYLYEAPMR